MVRQRDLDKFIAGADGGSEEAAKPTEKTVSVTISMPESLLEQVEDLAWDNKRKGVDNRTVSSLFRAAMAAYLYR